MKGSQYGTNTDNVAAHQPPTALDYYGATNPVEFFAVVIETFFEQAAKLAAQHPAMYKLPCDFYKVNPLSWR
jgi:Mlc titration factor MtfA (ptsG expression regulator)